MVEYRKLNRAGHSTLTISLPRLWIKKYGLNNGDRLKIDQEEERLIISITGEIRKREPYLKTKEQQYLDYLHLLSFLYGTERDFSEREFSMVLIEANRSRGVVEGETQIVKNVHEHLNLARTREAVRVFKENLESPIDRRYVLTPEENSIGQNQKVYYKLEA